MTTHITSHVVASGLREDSIERRELDSGAFLLQIGEPYSATNVSLGFGGYGRNAADPASFAQEAAAARKLATMLLKAADELDPYGGDAEESQREWEAEGMAAATR